MQRLTLARLGFSLQQALPEPWASCLLGTSRGFAVAAPEFAPKRKLADASEHSDFGSIRISEVIKEKQESGLQSAGLFWCKPEDKVGYSLVLTAAVMQRDPDGLVLRARLHVCTHPCSACAACLLHCLLVTHRSSVHSQCTMHDARTILCVLPCAAARTAGTHAVPIRWRNAIQ